MSNAFTALAILFWMGLGAAIGIGAMGVLVMSKEDDYAPYAWMLGKPCWVNVNGDYLKYRVVAVSHKGAVNIRIWDDETAKAVWVSKEKVAKGWVHFGEACPDEEGASL